MALQYAEELDLLCCGGAGLSMLGIFARPTKDVDVLAVSKGHNCGQLKNFLRRFAPPSFKPHTTTSSIRNGSIVQLRRRFFPEDFLTDVVDKPDLQSRTPTLVQTARCRRRQQVARFLKNARVRTGGISTHVLWSPTV